MNLKAIGLKIVSVAMIVFMMVSVCAPTIMAIPEGEEIIDIAPNIDFGNGILDDQSLEEYMTIAKAIIEAMADDNTDKQALLNEIQIMITDALVYLYENHEEIIEQAYTYANDNGYITALEQMVDEAIEKFDDTVALLLNGMEAIQEEVSEKLMATIEKIQEVLEELKKIISYEDFVKKATDLQAKLVLQLTELQLLVETKAIEIYDTVNNQIAYVQTVLIPELVATVTRVQQEISAYIQAQIAKVLDFAYATNDVIKAEVEIIQLQVLKTVSVIYDIALDVNATVEQAIVVVSDYIAKKIMASEYVVSEDSYYVAIGGEDYAALLANALKLTENQYTTISDIDLEEIIKADLISVVYDDSGMVTFAYNQTLGYVKNYLDGFARQDIKQAFVHLISTKFPYLNSKAQDLAQAVTDNVFDSVIGSAVFKDKEFITPDWAALVGAENVSYVNTLRETMKAELIKAGMPEIYDVTIDLVGLLCANKDVFGALAFLLDEEILYEFFGEEAYYTISIPMIDLALILAESALYEKTRCNKEYVQTLIEIQKVNPDVTIMALGGYDLLGIDFGKLEIEQTIPFGDFFMLDTLPAALLEFVAKLISEDFASMQKAADLAGVDFTENEATISFTIDFNVLKLLNSVPSVLCTAIFDNVVFVDISGAQSNLMGVVDDYMANGDVEALVTAILDIETLMAINPESAAYIATQMEQALRVTCDHIYDDACIDVDCNRCGAIREAGHTYTDNYEFNDDATHMEDGTKTIVCDMCGVRGVVTVVAEGTKLVDAHTFADAWLSDDNYHWNECECGEKNATAAHVDEDADQSCDVCSHYVAPAPVVPDDPTPPVDTPPAGDSGNDDPTPPAGDSGNDNPTPPADDNCGNVENNKVSGTTIAVLVATAVAATIIIFFLGWFFIAKKSLADFAHLFKRK